MLLPRRSDERDDMTCIKAIRYIVGVFCIVLLAAVIVILMSLPTSEDANNYDAAIFHPCPQSVALSIVLNNVAFLALPCPIPANR
jgi:hypothetical protein